MVNQHGDLIDILSSLSSLKDQINDLNTRLIKDHNHLASDHLTSAYSQLASASITIRTISRQMAPAVIEEVCIESATKVK